MSRHYNLIYGIALFAVVCLLVAGQVMLESNLGLLAHTSHTVNIAGRQRMLSQRIVKVIVLLPERPGLREQLERDLERFRQVHQGLLQGEASLGLKPPPPTVSERLQTLNTETLLARARECTRDRTRLDDLLLEDRRFDEVMDAVVTEYETLGALIAVRTRWLGLCIRALTLGTVLLMFALLFRPVQRELARVDTELSQVLDNSAELVGTLDSNNRLSYVNGSWVRALGYSIDELRGRLLAELLAPESKETWAAAGSPGRHQLELVFMSKEGKRCQVEGLCARSDAGASCYWRDVTQTRRLQETFDRFFHLSQDMLCITDRRGRFLKVNPAWIKAAGYGPEGQLGKTFLEYTHPDDLEETTRRAVQLATGTELGSWESRALRADGVYRWLLWNSVFDPREQVFYSSARDITESKQLQEDLVQAKQEAEQASRAKSLFLANMSHELRTPMNSILGFAQLLADESFGPLNERQARQAGHILKSGHHLLALIDDMLDLSRIEVGRLAMHIQPLRVKTAVLQQVASIGPLAEEKDVTLEVLPCPDDLHLQADSARFAQILLNLLSNAVKFTPSGGQVLVGVEASDQEVTVWVRDNGIGVHPDHHKRIFERFEQVDSTFGRQQQGTGLGLALTRQLVELMEGRIDVESTGVEGEGSRFMVTLPRYQSGG